jgi:hypothetical protein
VANLVEELGLDPETFKWEDLAACAGADTELFYDNYEKDSVLAAQADETCFNCPVMRACFATGRRNKEYGQWGGVYLNNGSIDQARNTHKTNDSWAWLKKELDI